MDPAVIVVGVVVTVLVVLIGLVALKMARGKLREGDLQKGLPPGEREEEEALAQEALAAREGAPPAELEAEAKKPAEAPEEKAPAKAPEAPPLETDERAMRRGLEKTRLGFMSKINTLLLGGRALDPSLVDELEEILVTSDIGIQTAQRLLGDLRSQLTRKEINDPEAVRARLRAAIEQIVSLPCQPLPFGDKKPVVLMVIGVNGVGKTTTIGKLAARFSKESRKVVVAAADTFRAAAVEQLEIWAQRAGAEVVKGSAEADPSSVVFEAVQVAQRNGADLCIADTAGRLHTKVNLMEELKKLRRVTGKAMEGAPHEVLLVLDATTGQNAISQAQQFTSAVQVSSLALTKLDGTAKGGVVVAICDQLKLPVRYVGVGERVEDLRDFNPREFAAALFERGDASNDEKA